MAAAITYDAENHQKQVKDTSTLTVLGDYYYDGEGRRVKKVTLSETTVFVYDGGGQLVAEYSTQTAQTPQTSYLTTDHLGSPRVTTDQLGAVTARKDYSAFGEETVTTERQSALGYSGADELRKGYAGYEKDNESGLDFAQARYYNSTHGRYTSVDPLTASASIRNPQTFNRYSYVLNSPYKFTDPLGLAPRDPKFRIPDEFDVLTKWDLFKRQWLKEQLEALGYCPEPCPQGTTTTTAPTNSPSLPDGWTIQGGTLVKTNGANNVGSVTVTGTEEGATVGKKRGWFSRVFGVLGRGARGAWGIFAWRTHVPKSGCRRRRSR